MSIFLAEARKAGTTRTNLWLGVGAAAVVAIGALMTTSATPAQDLTGPVHDQPLFLLASVNLSLFALLLGVRSSTDEFRHGTITWTLLAVRRRWQAVAAKAAVAALHAALISTVALAAGSSVALVVSSGEGGDLQLGASDAAAFVGLTGAAALWAGIGVGVGVLIRHQVTASVTVTVWVLAIENLGVSFLGDVGRYLPGQAAHAIASMDMAAPMLPTPAATALFAGYALLTLAGASVSLERRSITT